MVKVSSKKKFQAVIVYQLDRFARNRFDSAIYRVKLKKNGVKDIVKIGIVFDGKKAIAYY